jgi:hypothetical protein
MTDEVKPASFAEKAAKATRARRTATVCLAGHLVDEFDLLEQRLGDLVQQARASDSLADSASGERLEVAQRMEDLRGQMAELEVAFTFEALHPKAWSDLSAEHPAREDRREAFNTESFPLAACLTCLVQVDGADVEPGTSDVFTDIWINKLNEGQRGDLFDACWAANTGRISVPFSVLASRTLHSTDEK